MGRLRFGVAIRWWRALVIVLALIAGMLIYAHTSKVDTPAPEAIERYTKDHWLSVGTDDSSGFQQVYYVYDGIKQIITEGSVNHFNPVYSGRYIAWTETAYGDNQQMLYLYDAVTRVKTQLTFYGSVSSFVLDQNHVVWVPNQEQPQIMYYDGARARQISSEHISLRPQINGNLIAYAQHLGGGSWRVMEYNTESQQTRVVAAGDHYQAWPKYINGQLHTDKP